MLRKKSLGQNFLNNKKILGKIVEAGDLQPEELVLEIGPGEGSLTKLLLESGVTVIAVEKDDRLIPFLSQKFDKEISEKKLLLVHGDIMKTDLYSYNFKDLKYKLIANIPYYLTGGIFRKFLSDRPRPEKIVVLVQKEVAKRAVGKKIDGSGKESLLSLGIKFFGRPKIVCPVKAGSFSPAPKVDSAVLTVSDIADKNPPEKEALEYAFFEVARAGFARKRKVIFSNLKKIFGNETEKKLALCGIEKKERAENITLEKWLCLAEKWPGRKI